MGSKSQFSVFRVRKRGGGGEDCKKASAFCQRWGGGVCVLCDVKKGGSRAHRKVLCVRL